MEPVRREDKKIYKKSRINSPNRSDLDNKVLRETFGRIDDICKYFYKSDFAVKNWRLCYTIRDFYLKNYPPL